MRKFMLLILALFLAGCGAPEREQLGPEWFPLRYVQQDETVPAASMWTYGRTSRVRSLRWWRATFPPGSVARQAILAHERRHSLRSFQVPHWAERYWDDTAFRLQEEQDGYTIQFEVQVDAHEAVPTVDYAHFMAGPAYGYMTTPQAAEAWCNATVAALVSSSPAR